MPLYEYECEACGKRFEKIQKFSDPLADVCPHCGKGPVKKLLSSPAIQFKGTGWYITDYPKKSSGSGKESKEAKEGKESKEAKDSKDSKESKDSASTTETKPATSSEKKD
jgi:putative FmdB family regulatory protein